jgi:hypothetical protein
MIQPFEIVEGPTYMRYYAWFASENKKKELQDRERYKAMVKIDPWGNLTDYSCECKSFLFNKKLCKHLLGKDEPGLLDVLVKWGEIDSIPREGEKE